MNCQDIEGHVFDFLTNRLSSKQNNELKNHIKKCADCRAKVAESKSLLKRLNIIKPAKLPKDFSQQVMAGIIAKEKADSVTHGFPNKIRPMLAGLFSKITHSAPLFATALLVIGLASLLYQQKPAISPVKPSVKQNEIHLPSPIHIGVTDIDLGLQKINNAVKHARGIVEYQEALGPDTWRVDIQLSPQSRHILFTSLKDQDLDFENEIAFNDNNMITIILSVRKEQ